MGNGEWGRRMKTILLDFFVVESVEYTKAPIRIERWMFISNSDDLLMSSNV